MSVTLISLLLLTILNNAKGNNTVKDEIENVRNTRYKRQEGWQFVECILPPHPENGQWQVISGTGTPGSAILPNTLIKFSCNRGFALEPEAEYFLCDTDWDPSKMPRCVEKLCPPLKSSLVKFVKCFNGKGNPIECSKVRNGGTATTKCAPYYDISNKEASTIQCLYEKWSETPPECNITCGKAVDDRALQLIYQNKSIPKYPWISTLFEKENGKLTYICSGSLISTSHVLTAAHCIAGEFGDPRKASNYRVSAGKTYQAYGDPRDLMAQYVDVENLLIHPKFRGLDTNYEADIAVLKTKHPFRLSALVQPICIRGLPETRPTDNDKGVFAMWGVTQNYELTEEVKYFKSNIKREECIKKFTLDFIQKYLTADKLCIHFNNSLDTICKGHSGTGFAVEKTDRNRFFIQGIISVGPLDKATRCSQPTNLCTRTLYYYDFILDTMEKL